jgi:hypothetical protein
LFFAVASGTHESTLLFSPIYVVRLGAVGVVAGIICAINPDNVRVRVLSLHYFADHLRAWDVFAAADIVSLIATTWAIVITFDFRHIELHGKNFEEDQKRGALGRLSAR